MNNDKKKYLITEAVDIKELPKEKIGEDLKLLSKYENRAKVKTDISRNLKNEKLTQVMRALQLKNPFKGF